MNDSASSGAEIPSVLLAAFGVLRRAQTPRDRDAEFTVIPKVVDRYGLLSDQVREARLSGPVRAWIRPGLEGAGLSISAEVGMRSTWYSELPSIAVDGIGGYSVSGEGVRTHYGLVPDGICFLNYDLGGGRSVRAAVEDNVFVVREPENFRDVVFLDSAGNRVIWAERLEEGLRLFKTL